MGQHRVHPAELSSALCGLFQGQEGNRHQEHCRVHPGRAYLPLCPWVWGQRGAAWHEAPPHCPKPSSRVGLSWGAALCARPGGNHTPHAHGLCAHPGAALAIPVAAQPRGLPKPGDRLCLPRPPAHSQANAVWNRAFIWVAHSGPCSRTLFPTTSTPPSPPTHPLLPSRGGCSRFFPARSSSRSSASAVPRPRTSTAAAAPAPGGGRAGG